MILMDFARDQAGQRELAKADERMKKRAKGRAAKRFIKQLKANMARA